MTHYRTLLFDIDDTLLDFGATEQGALRKLFESEGLAVTTELLQSYRKINQGLWAAFEAGAVTRDELFYTRFSRFFSELGKERDGVWLEHKYRSFLDEGHDMIEGAKDLITRLHGNFDLYIVTNGLSLTQHRRLTAAGLLPYFKNVFVSEDTGYQKPMKEYFDYVIERIPGFSAETALIIGDSLTADIRGGNQAGIDTCWFNPHRKANETGILPTYEITYLDELEGILETNLSKIR
ncbi:noncanonical pyrimidine nucleotidase, YjjG family [Bacillus sp. FJAT-27225]|uniref:YjjG family noncanonical pyrimidine nucleotidase n=1 Tax=Bacillus sp. FJAT-27225 TaxID=1743144 RepID=UPI00080C2699|nr:YjjG family noncanonical pyrimidine nucleotidase [Bacillus sp. FJAT-27225]OCA91507.1 noncanonical pyrimidine nucleotidase, YjjG family [Bacillus sp. FJAT-27225]